MPLADAVWDSFTGVIGTFIAYLPQIIGAIVLVILGWVLGKIIGGVVTRALRAVQFDQIASRAEIDRPLQAAGVQTDPAGLVGGLVRWVIYLVFFLAAFSALGLPQVSEMITGLVGYLPLVAVAIVVLFVGALAGKLLAGIVRASAASMGLGSPDLFGNIARFGVIAFAAIMALDILQIAPNIVSGLWLGLLALIVGSLVLAFGLGGQRAASDLIVGRLLRAELEPGIEIDAGEYQGRVVTIGSLYTTLETGQDGVIKVPNGALTSRTVHMDQLAYREQTVKRREMRQQAREAVKQGANESRQENNSSQQQYRPAARTQ